MARRKLTAQEIIGALLKALGEGGKTYFQGKQRQEQEGYNRQQDRLNRRRVNALDFQKQQNIAADYNLRNRNYELSQKKFGWGKEEDIRDREFAERPVDQPEPTELDQLLETLNIAKTRKQIRDLTQPTVPTPTVPQTVPIKDQFKALLDISRDTRPSYDPETGAMIDVSIGAEGAGARLDSLMNILGQGRQPDTVSQTKSMPRFLTEMLSGIGSQGQPWSGKSPDIRGQEQQLSAQEHAQGLRTAGITAQDMDWESFSRDYPNIDIREVQRLMVQ